MANEKQVPGASAKNGEFVAFDLSNDNIVSNPNAGEADAFGAKSANNRFAQSACIRIVGNGAFHYKWGANSDVEADANDDLMPANTPEYMAVNNQKRYLSVYAASDVKVFVKEIGTIGPTV